MSDLKKNFHRLKVQLASWTEDLPAKVRHWFSQPTDWKRVFRIGGITTLAGGFLLFIFVLLVYRGAFGPLPTYSELREIRNHTASEVYSADGVLLGKYYVENRVNTDFEEISPDLINALVATEDARFFQHGGIDFKSWGRVFLKTILLSNESSGGGSTISQQLAKNLYPRRDHGLLTLPVNKIREVFVARRLEKLYPKEELLRLYLNTVPFGENVYGIKVAAQRFFNSSPANLKTEEAAVLVGMLKANTLYNPVRNPEGALARRNTVLRQMAKYGYLPPEVSDSLKELPLQLEYVAESHNRGLATYFRAHLQAELEGLLDEFEKPNGGSYNLYTDGLKIYTTIDAAAQQWAESAVNKHMPELQRAFDREWKNGTPWGHVSQLEREVANSKRYRDLKEREYPQKVIEKIFSTPVSMTVFSWEKGEEKVEMSPLDSIKYYMTLLNTGMVAADPHTGHIKAWVGGIDHKYFQYDHAMARRQVGSTFKPIVYAQALRAGMLPCEYTPNRLHTYPEFDDWEPKNSDGTYGGVYSMEGALSHSVNTVTVEIMMRAGIDSVQQLARRLGITGEIPAVPAISLGAVDASPLDMIRVYSSFANGGKRPRLHYLDRIENSRGEVIASFSAPDPDDFEQVLRPETAAVVTRMLESVVDSGTARRLRYEYGLRGAIAGKTGTSQNQSDGWFVGFTPDLVAAVWVGAEMPSVHFRTLSTGQGSNSALPIWGEFVKQAYRSDTYRRSRTARFAAPPDSLVALLQCPPYLEEMPVIVDFWADYDENPAFFNRVLRELEIQLGEDQALSLKRRRFSESPEEYIERMLKYNERLERRKDRRQERKNFWSKLLFGKDDDGG
ncbi:MAG: transglycosylase domain-containing protein [Saprospiraceae bacterium]|nr:transglycosylase domain-containing protein [Saprospiraceae bacterium]